MQTLRINRKGRSLAEIFELSPHQADVLARRCFLIKESSRSIGELFSGILRSSESPEELALVAFTLGARSGLFDEVTRSSSQGEEKIIGIYDEDLREYQ